MRSSFPAIRKVQREEPLALSLGRSTKSCIFSDERGRQLIQKRKSPIQPAPRKRTPSYEEQRKSALAKQMEEEKKKRDHEEFARGFTALREQELRRAAEAEKVLGSLVRDEDVPGIEKILYEAKKLDVNVPTDDHGNTSLHIAAAMGSRTIVRKLVRQRGCDLGALNKNGQTAADMCREWSDDLAMARWLNWLRLQQIKGLLLQGMNRRRHASSRPALPRRRK